VAFTMTRSAATTSRGNRIRALARATMLGLVLCLAPLPARAGPPAGTPIDNIASGSSVDSVSGQPRNAASNLVRAVVQPLEGVSLRPDRGGTAPPGGNLTLSHVLTNTGNVAASVRLDLSELGGDDFDLLTRALARDINNNGLFDGGDIPIPNGGSVSLAAGDSIALLVSATLPAPLAGGARALLELRATTALFAATAFVRDTVTADSSGTPPPPVAPTLTFFTDATYATRAFAAPTVGPLYVAANAPAANLDPARPDSIALALASGPTGDTETYVAIETGPSSGVFRVAGGVPTTVAVAALAGNVSGVLEVRRNDTVTATLWGFGALRTDASVYIEPAGIVFDARTNLAMPGATVSLIDVTGGGPGIPARVFLDDGVTPAPGTVVTDAAGHYLFPRVRPGQYQIAIAPPAGYGFPSRTPIAQLPGGHTLDPAGSYGQSFSIVAGDAPVSWDAPLDALPQYALFVEKQASRGFAEIGDQVDYTVRVESRSDSAMAAVALTDRLPVGFRYVKGSALRDGAPIADPAGGVGPELTFALGGFGPMAVSRVRYRVEVGPGAIDGDGINRAFASADTVQSNVASAQVELSRGVFAPEAIVLGTVFVDRDGDGRRGAGEPGMPGVRVFADDGTFAITDGDGQYSLYGLEPRTHALRVDRTSLPRGARLLSISRRDMDTPGLRAVDLQRGDLQRADFAIAPDWQALDAVDRRRAAGWPANELDRVTGQLQIGANPQSQGDPRSRPASGIAGGDTRLPLFGDIAQQVANPRLFEPTHGALSSPAARRDSVAPAPTVPTVTSGGIAPTLAEGSLAPPTDAIGATPGSGATPAGVVTRIPGAMSATGGPAPTPAAPIADADAQLAAPSLEQVAPSLSSALDFIGLVDGDTLAWDQIAVRVKGAIGRGFELRVNDQPVPETRVGRRVTAPAQGVEAWEYIGVALRPGVNTLTVAQPRAGDVDVPAVMVRVVAPDRIHHLEIRTPPDAPADGHSIVAVQVRVLDRSGIPVGARTLVTLESSLGQWQVPDLDPQTPGLQTAIADGETAIGLLAPPDPGIATIHARSADTEVSGTLAFIPDLRPLVVVGMVEGVVSFRNLTRGANAAEHPRTGFESSFDEFVSESQDGERMAGARGSVFAKGRIARDMLLTLGYATDKPDDLRRFRDIQPDEFYPVYGDASVRGYEAQSTGHLYARLDRRGSSLMYGDFVTTTGGGSSTLANYSRSFTGAAEHYEDPRLRLDAFASRTRAVRRIVELPGRGISGPYTLPDAPIVENSEQIEIVTRDRNQSQVVIRSEHRSRFTDYEIDPLTGVVTFKMPIPMLDPGLNPVSVRIVYDAGAGGEPYWVSGVDGRVQITPRIELGGTYVDDHDPLVPRELRGLSMGLQLGEGTVLETEWAGTRLVGGPRGDGGRVELRHKSDAIDARAWGAATDSTFDNPTAGTGAGRLEAGGRFNARIDAKSQFRAEALYTGDVAGDVRTGGGLAMIDRTINESLRGELGMRVAGQVARQGEVNPTSYAARGRLLAQLPRHPQVSGFAELEQSVTDSRRMAAVGGEYRFTARGRLYLRHELISSLVGPYQLNEAQRQLSTVFGVDADLSGEAHVFSEYRLDNALSGREAEAALGLRNAWTLAPGLRVGTSFERVSPVMGSDRGPQTALTGSVEHTAGEDWRGSARLEVRTARESDSFLSSFAAGWRLDPAWTAIARNFLSVTDDHASGGRNRERLQVGLAYREPVRDDWDALLRYELHADRDAPADDVFAQRAAHVFAVNGTGRVFESFSASAAWAGKRVFDRAGGPGTTSGAQWVRGRFTWDMGDRWDAGVQGSTLWSGDFASRRHGVGVELGRQMGGGVWLSAGWNRFGFEDRDLTAEEYTQEGAYVRLRARFDETLFNGLRGTP